MVGIGGVGFGSDRFAGIHQQQQRSFERLGSGKRINSAADDAANLATVQQFLAMESGAARGERNLQDGQGMVRTAEAALGGTSEILGRMRELTMQAQNGTLSDTDRSTIQDEFDQLSAEVTRISESTGFNGRSLLNGDLSGSGAVQLADGSGSPGVRIEIQGQSASDLGVAGLNIADPASLDRLDAAIDSVSSSRASLGASSNRIDSQVENLRVTQETAAAARSRIEDADYAAETANLTKANILGEAQVALQIQGRSLQSNSVLKLLG